MSRLKKITKQKTPRESLADKVYYLIRVAALISVLLMFFPAFNPARISGMINKNMSLFTSGISYSSLIAEFGRAFKKGWILQSTMRLLYASSIGMIVGIAVSGAAGCMSLGNMKYKKLGNLLSVIGCAVQYVGMIGVICAYTAVSKTSKPEKIEPMFPVGLILFLVVTSVLFLANLIVMYLLRDSEKEEKFFMETKYKLFLILMPFLVLAAVFCYLPLFGWRYAFFDYKPGETLTMDKFVGFKWFKELFMNSATVKDIGRVIKNTLGMSLLGILTSWVPVAFAIFLSEIKNTHFRKFVQTFTTIPNFISWVLVYAIAVCLFSTDGFISSMMVNMGVWSEGRNMLMSGSHTWLKMWAWGMWKGIGWSAIIYIAGISGIDQQLYEAARVDGAGRFQRMLHVTIPGLMPTFCVLLLMSIANILNNGMEQYLVFKNSTNTDAIQVLDLYVYQLGLVKNIIPLSTVIGMLKSLISVTLLFVANRISKLIRGESII
ncbi:MAG: ABC transporter permease subunit [Lachnospiraceae bacterium]